MQEKIDSAKKRLREKYKFEFPIVLVNDSGASIQPTEIWVGKLNPLEIIEVTAIHEAYHIIFRIDQTETFKEKDKGNPLPYFEQEMWIWDKIKEDFPDLSDEVDLAIKLEKEALGIK